MPLAASAQNVSFSSYHPRRFDHRGGCGLGGSGRRKLGNRTVLSGNRWPVSVAFARAKSTSGAHRSVCQSGAGDRTKCVWPTDVARPPVGRLASAFRSVQANVPGPVQTGSRFAQQFRQPRDRTCQYWRRSAGNRQGRQPRPGQLLGLPDAGDERTKRGRSQTGRTDSHPRANLRD